MTEMLSRIAWVEEDTDLVDRLDEVWEKWREEGDEGLIAKLDEDEAWYGWADWTDDEKRERLTAALDEWFAADEVEDEAEDVDRLAWVREDDALVARLDENWQGWDAADETGLLATLDEESDWSGWDDWSDDDKREFLGTTLDGWYPPADGAADEAAEVDRLAWVSDELSARLTANWPGWEATDESGLLAVLDTDENWSGWSDWSDDDKRDYLGTTLDGWYPSEDEPEAVRIVLPDDTADEPAAGEDGLEAAPRVVAEPDGLLDAPAVEIDEDEAAAFDEVLTPVLQDLFDEDDLDFAPEDLDDPEIQAMIAEVLQEHFAAR